MELKLDFRVFQSESKDEKEKERINHQSKQYEKKLLFWGIAVINKNYVIAPCHIRLWIGKQWETTSFIGSVILGCMYYKISTDGIKLAFFILEP